MNEETLFAVVDRLETVFGVDVSEARKLTGPALEDWVDKADEALFQSLLADLPEFTKSKPFTRDVPGDVLTLPLARQSSP